MIRSARARMICSSEAPTVGGSFHSEGAVAPEPSDPVALARAQRTRTRAERPTLREIDVPLVAARRE